MSGERMNTKEVAQYLGIQAFLDVLNSREFRQRVEPIGAYDLKDSGKILYSTI